MSFYTVLMKADQGQEHEDRNSFRHGPIVVPNLPSQRTCSFPSAGQLAWSGNSDNQGEIREDRYTSGHYLPRLLVIDSSIEQSGQASTDENEVPDPTE